MAKRICDSLREARENAFLKQIEVSNATSINNKNISHWENGVASPCLEDAIKLADLYKVTLDELVGRKFQNQNRITLSVEEIRLITNFRILNGAGKQKAIDYIDDQTENPKFTQKEKTSSAS